MSQPPLTHRRFTSLGVSALFSPGFYQLSDIYSVCMRGQGTGFPSAAPCLHGLKVLLQSREINNVLLQQPRGAVFVLSPLCYCRGIFLCLSQCPSAGIGESPWKAPSCTQCVLGPFVCRSSDIGDPRPRCHSRICFAWGLCPTGLLLHFPLPQGEGLRLQSRAGDAQLSHHEAQFVISALKIP